MVGAKPEVIEASAKKLKTISSS
jgi:hypothetical protein